jgi:hypothetical protein
VLEHELNEAVCVNIEMMLLPPHHQHAEHAQIPALYGGPLGLDKKGSVDKKTG